ncbi:MULTISPECIES: lasso peptide biosynthesis B2 protein [Pseudomonas]|uniref:Lasso peptide biosynthesis B2 protein n=1 Tax=Pseudomonas aphyarum TaxID=2942629 RepID=A0ABT5PH78_9PSED|nr:lasso peptide biosynthesis B2 protein [Pseudomonas aphyarum]MDD0967828.1 lasso peptide biosynthesis B2 protein [Pseudomonas aphyarum]MDD1123139.1 lasso peptide biosynthesis B2 protein [Pseudomonas aphyarum]
MDFAFQPHIHHILMHNQLVILDERRDSYTVFSEAQTKVLIEGDKLNDQYYAMCKKLTALNVISHSNTPQTLITAKENYEGVDNYIWRTGRNQISKSTGLLPTVRAALDLIRLKAKLNRCGLGSVLDNMRLSKKHLIEKHNASYLDRLESYAREIHAASVALPFKIKCLESSICLFNHAIKNGKSCDFFIGVQLFDFLSHAWVEVDGQVIADDKDLSRKLPKILKI